MSRRTSTVAVRRLAPGDGATLAVLARDAPDFDLPGVSEPEDPLPDDDADRYLASGHVLHWVAEVDDRVVGELLCHHLPLPQADRGELLLYSVGVRSGWRRRGVGRALVAAMTSWMAEHSVGTVWVLADNPDAERFYRACGFRIGEPHEQGVLLVRGPTGSQPA